MARGRWILFAAAVLVVIPAGRIAWRIRKRLRDDNTERDEDEEMADALVENAESPHMCELQ